MSRRLPFWLALLFFSVLAVGTDEFVIAGALPAIARDLHVSAAATGQLITAFALAYALGAPVLAVLTAAQPRRRLLTTALVVFAVGNAGAALAPSYWVLLAARIVVALAAAAISAGAYATAAAGAPSGRQARYLAVVTAGLTVALFTGVPVGTWLAGSAGWRAVFWMLAALGAAVALGIAATAPAIGGAPTQRLRERLAPLRSGAVLRLCATTFSSASGGLMFYTYLGPLSARVGGGYAFLTLVLLVVGLCGVGAVLLAGLASDRGGAERTLRLVIAGHAAALALVAAVVYAVPRRADFLVAVAVWSFFAWGLNPPMQARLIAVAPQAAMSVMALNVSALFLGTAAGGALGGALISAAGVRVVPVAGALLLVAALGVLGPRLREREAAAACVGSGVPAADGLDRARG